MCCWCPRFQGLPRDTSLATRLSRNIALNVPLVSAAMDTVTEARLAIAIAQEGGIGIVHKNISARAQAAEVVRVKRYESGLLRDPITVRPTCRCARSWRCRVSTGSPASRSCRARRWWASSPAGICGSRRASTRRYATS